MACKDWLEYNGTVLVNHARTVALSRSLGIDTVRIRPESVAWIEDAIPVYTGFGLGGFGLGEFGLGEIVPQDYADVTTAPWYDPDYPISGEFAGLVALDLSGFDDSTFERETIEYITKGGNAGKARNATLAMVARFAIIAKSERGAEFGKRWLDRVLHADGPHPFSAGVNLRYSRWAAADAPVAHRRDVSLSRGTSVTSRRDGRCASTWIVTFTLTAADPMEYGEPELKVAGLGGAGEFPEAGGDVTAAGALVAVETPCAEWDYSPIYDPLYPALVAPPSAPDFYPAGWGIEAGDTFYRRWARIGPVEPSTLNTVPMIQLHTTVEARMVRVSVWRGNAEPDDQCDPLFSAVVSYLPAHVRFYIDGEQQASYVWDGYSPVVRRTDSLVYSPEANPVQWAAFNDPDGLLVTLDVFAKAGGGFGYEGNGFVTASLALTPQSD